MARISPDMGAHKTRFQLIQGDSFSYTFTLKSGGELVEFTDCTAVLQVREKFGKAEPGKPALLTLTEISGLLLGDVDGTITINLTPTQTQTATFSRARFQLRATDTTTGISATLLQGEIKILPSVIV